MIVSVTVGAIGTLGWLLAASAGNGVGACVLSCDCSGLLWITGHIVWATAAPVAAIRNPAALTPSALRRRRGLRCSGW